MVDSKEETCYEFWSVQLIQKKVKWPVAYEIKNNKGNDLHVGHLESKERLRIQPAQLFNFS